MHMKREKHGLARDKGGCPASLSSSIPKDPVTKGKLLKHATERLRVRVKAYGKSFHLSSPFKAEGERPKRLGERGGSPPPLASPRYNHTCPSHRCAWLCVVWHVAGVLDNLYDQAVQEVVRRRDEATDRLEAEADNKTVESVGGTPTIKQRESCST
jgi:hypothetical protein